MTREALFDGCGRQVTYLRLSVTDRCNYRCTYCMPPEGIRDKLPPSCILSFEEAASLVRILAEMGISRIRLTGGEPLVRRGLEELVLRLRELPGIERILMTTNGHGLAERLPGLVQAGLSGVSVSLDSLDPTRFRAITRVGDLAEVRAGIEAAARTFRGVRLNTVAIRGFNDDELGRICTFAWSLGCVPRFIEHMPMSDGALRLPGSFMSAEEVRQRLLTDLGGTLEPDEGDGVGSGPARYYRHSSGGLVGFIAPLTEHFCADCNRVRLDARGRLHTCLYHETGADLASLLRTGGEAAVRHAVREALRLKPALHRFATEGASPKHMAALGG